MLKKIILSFMIPLWLSAEVHIDSKIENNKLSTYIANDNAINQQQRTFYFFIDIDNDVNTGYTNNADNISGADYMLENDTLYKSQSDGTSWSWSMLSQESSWAEDNALGADITLDNLPNIASIVNVGVYVVNENWIKVDSYHGDEMDKFVLEEVEIKSTIDNDKLSVYISGSNEKPIIPRDHIYFFIDMDNNTNTGYTSANISGADYMIGDEILYKSNSNGSGWNWTSLENGSYWSDNNAFGMDIELIDLASIASSINISVIAMNVIDGDWIKVASYHGETMKAFTFDMDYLKIYQNGEELSIYKNTNPNRVSITRHNGNEDKDLIDTDNNSNYFIDNQELNITYTITERKGGFDVDYVIRNNANYQKSLPILQIPGIKFGNTEILNILNPYMQHYLQTRNFTQEQAYLKDDGTNAHAGGNYFAVGNVVRTVSEMGNNTYELHYPYGDQFIYSPVIVATNGNYTVGSSLNLDYMREELRHIKPLMSIAKEDDNTWTYRYDLTKSSISANTTINLTIPVRFSDTQNWIYTLYPYKTFFNGIHGDDKSIKAQKDLRPIQAIQLSYPMDKDMVNDDVSRQWARTFSEDNGTTIPLRKVLEKMGNRLKAKGYERSMIWDFTGTYANYQNVYENNCPTNDGSYRGCMHQQLPFQFVGNYTANMEADITYILQNGLPEFQGIEMGYDWGISGNIPVDSAGNTASPTDWRPYDVVPFNYNNGTHVSYAWYYLIKAKELQGIFQPKFIRLDAFDRMDLTGRIKWLKVLKEELPNTTFATESSIDYMHARTSSILQLDSMKIHTIGICGDKGGCSGNIEELNVTTRDILGDYLNPGAETIVWVQESVTALRETPAERFSYIQQLVSMEYTPLVEYSDHELGDCWPEYTGQVCDNEKRYKGEAIININNIIYP